MKRLSLVRQELEKGLSSKFSKYIYQSNFVSFRSTGCIFGTMMQITIGQHMKCLNLELF